MSLVWLWKERKSECVCVCVWERERERETMCVCVCKRETMCVCEWGAERFGGVAWLAGWSVWWSGKVFFFLKVSYALSHLNSTVTFKWDTSDNEKKCLMLLRRKTFMTEVLVFPTRQLHQFLFRSFFEFHVWSQLKKGGRIFIKSTSTGSWTYDRGIKRLILFHIEPSQGCLSLDYFDENWKTVARCENTLEPESWFFQMNPTWFWQPVLLKKKKNRNRDFKDITTEKKIRFWRLFEKAVEKKSSQKKISCNWLGQQKLDKKGSIRWKKRINRRQRRRRRRRVSDTVRQDLSVTASKTKRLRNT